MSYIELCELIELCKLHLIALIYTIVAGFCNSASKSLIAHAKVKALFFYTDSILNVNIFHLRDSIQQ